jgi:hypothetical protein
LIAKPETERKMAAQFLRNRLRGSKRDFAASENGEIVVSRAAEGYDARA